MDFTKSNLMKGVKIIELEGYFPSAFLGKILVDNSAEVTLISSKNGIPMMEGLSIYLHNNKNKIVLDLKTKKDKEILLELVKNTDVLIESFRPGVLEKLGLSPVIFHEINPQLIILRLTGYGQIGVLKNLPGHDINYMSFSGILEDYKTENRIIAPFVLLGDIFGGTISSYFKLTNALLFKQIFNRGVVIDSSITNNLHSIGKFTSLLKNNSETKKNSNDLCYLPIVIEKEGDDYNINIQDRLYIVKFDKNSIRLNELIKADDSNKILVIREDSDQYIKLIDIIKSSENNNIQFFKVSNLSEIDYLHKVACESIQQRNEKINNAKF